MICNECGREISETDKFCGICGTPNPLYQAEDDPAREYPFYTPPVSETANEYHPYEHKEEPAEMKMAGRKAKVKRTCSLSAVVVCIVVIFLLSVACGVFAGLYFSVRPAAVPAYSITSYESGGEY